jgi:hypothetical protein
MHRLSEPPDGTFCDHIELLPALPVDAIPVRFRATGELWPKLGDGGLRKAAYRGG